MAYPMVRAGVEQGRISLYGWHYVIEDGEVHVFDAQQRGFVAASRAQCGSAGTYAPYVEHDGQVLVDA